MFMGVALKNVISEKQTCPIFSMDGSLYKSYSLQIITLHVTCACKTKGRLSANIKLYFFTVLLVNVYGCSFKECNIRKTNLSHFLNGRFYV